MKNNNDQKWTVKELLLSYTKDQVKKQVMQQQDDLLKQQLQEQLMNTQAQNLSQFVPGAQPQVPQDDFEAYAKQGGIYIDPSKRGTFKAQATRMGMSVQEAARHILSNKDKYSPKMVKKANFARNFAKEEGGEMFGMESMGGDDDDRKWWQFWKKDKPMSELDTISQQIKEIDEAIYYLSQKGSVGQPSFNEQANNYYNPYTQRVENLKIKREGLIQKLNSIKSAESDAIAKQKEAKANEDAYNARIKAEQDALKKEAEEKAFQEARKKLKESVNNNQKAYGGQMNNAPQNSGFQALPDYVQKKILENMEYGGSYGLDEYKSGGYTVRRSSDRKGKTHVVIGPDGTKKYFGDPGMGERSKSKYGKEAFYKRHAQNLKDNPYFRAYARATWEEGGEIENEDYENEENENEDYEMVSGIADILQQVKDKENRRQIAENMIEDFEEEDVDYNLQKFMDMAKLKRGGEMIKRADGSYSQRGLWDNIRANKGSGKAPTKEMLAQERKIKKKRYDDGGTLPSCEEGYYWNPDTQSCQPISLNTDVQNNKEFLIKMANSPLFAERYARMTGSNNLEDAEKLRQNILNNIDSVKYKQTPKVEAKGYLGKYMPNTHTIKFTNPSATTLLHELSHASTKGHKNFSKDQVNNLKKRWNYDPYYGLNLIDEKFAYLNNDESKSQPLKDFKNAYKMLSGMMFANSKSEKYLKTPTEVKARVDVARKKLSDKGLYDPVNEKFTEKNYNSLKEELLRNNGQGLLKTIFGENSEDNYDILELLNNYSKEDVIDMFNSFVSNSPDTNQGYAKRGGQLGRFLL